MELTRYASPLGTIFLAADNGALAGLWLEGQKYFAATLDEAAVERDDLRVPSGRRVAGRLFCQAASSGSAAAGSQRQRFPSGGVAAAVGDPLRSGNYLRRAGQILRDRGISAAAQAVGGAVGHNPISILIPCHRVVGADAVSLATPEAWRKSAFCWHWRAWI